MEITINGKSYQVKVDQTFKFNLGNGGDLLVRPDGHVYTENVGTKKVATTTFDGTGRKVTETKYDSHIHRDQPVLNREFNPDGSPKLERIFNKAYIVDSQLLYEEKHYGPEGLTDHFYKYKEGSKQWNEFRGEVDEKGNPIEGTMLYKENERLLESFKGSFYPNGSEREGTSVFLPESIFKSISSRYNQEGTPIAKQIIEFKENDESHREKLTETYDSSGNMVSGKLLYRESNPCGFYSFEGIFYDDVLEPKQGKMWYIDRPDDVCSFEGSFDKEGNPKEGLLEYSEDCGPFRQYEGKFTRCGFFKEGYLEYNENDKDWFSFTGTFDKENEPDKGTIHYLYDLGCTTSDGELPGVKWTGKVDFKSDGDFQFIFPQSDDEESVGNIRGYLNEDGVYCSNFQKPGIEKKHMEKYYLNVVKLLKMKVKYTESNSNRKRSADSDLAAHFDFESAGTEGRKRFRNVFSAFDDIAEFDHIDEDIEEATILSGPVHELQ